MCAAHAIAVDASSVYMCIDEWRPTASMLSPFSLSHKKSQEWGCGYPQNKAQMDHLQRISPAGCFFERNTYHVTTLGWLKKKERRNLEDEQFWLLTVSGLPL